MQVVINNFNFDFKILNKVPENAIPTKYIGKYGDKALNIYQNCWIDYNGIPVGLHSVFVVDSDNIQKIPDEIIEIPCTNGDILGFCHPMHIYGGDDFNLVATKIQQYKQNNPIQYH